MGTPYLYRSSGNESVVFWLLRRYSFVAMVKTTADRKRDQLEWPFTHPRFFGSNRGVATQSLMGSGGMDYRSMYSLSKRFRCLSLSTMT